MVELANLEAERENPTYLSESRKAKSDRTEGMVRHGRKTGSVTLADGEPEKKGRVVSNEMCTFLILNISSLQLIPVNMIVYRQQYGSVNPAGIIFRR